VAELAAESGPPSFATFRPIQRVCRDPLPGQPKGTGEGGKVCFFEAGNGAVDDKHKFIDYANCDVVRTQRAYAPLGPSKFAKKEDPRLANPAYAAELAWVRSQTESTGCSCCHSASKTPRGPAVFDTEASGNWVSTFSAYGLALAAGLLDSKFLGSFKAAENNGFARQLEAGDDLPGVPSNDPARMRKFFLGELANRGLSAEDFAGDNATPGYMVGLSRFQPAACTPGSGVAPDGTILWKGPPARYLRVMGVGSKNPITPPNWDNPEGTIWRLDASPDGGPIPPGAARFGAPFPGTTQAIPKEGSPAALVKGKSYYLYVELDVIVPVERCIFTF
jgi:hypothetical protein